MKSVQGITRLLKLWSRHPESKIQCCCGHKTTPNAVAFDRLGSSYVQLPKRCHHLSKSVRKAFCGLCQRLVSGKPYAIILHIFQDPLIESLVTAFHLPLIELGFLCRAFLQPNLLLSFCYRSFRVAKVWKADVAGQCFRPAECGEFFHRESEAVPIKYISLRQHYVPCVLQAWLLGAQLVAGDRPEGMSASPLGSWKGKSCAELESPASREEMSTE